MAGVERGSELGLSVRRCVCYLLSCVWLFMTPWTVQFTRLLCPWNSPGMNTGVSCHFLVQGIFPTQRLIPWLLHCRQSLYHLSHQGSPVWGGEGYKNQPRTWGSRQRLNHFVLFNVTFCKNEETGVAHFKFLKLFHRRVWEVKWEEIPSKWDLSQTAWTFWPRGGPAGLLCPHYRGSAT